jgi:hypothetical protein
MKNDQVISNDQALWTARSIFLQCNTQEFTQKTKKRPNFKK